jgi:hypothetical protein
LPTPTKTTVEGQAILGHLYSEEWFEESARREVYVRYYTMPFQPKTDFYIPGLDGNVVVYANTVFKIVVAHIADQKYLSHIPWLVQSEADTNKIVVEKLERLLPATNYILVTTPIRGVGDQAYRDASEKMDSFVGILRLVGGNNLLRQLVREGKVDVASGNIATPTSLVPVPSAREGPFTTVETWEGLKEITNSVSGSSSNSKKGRIELSTQLIELAFLADARFKFFSYWVALEVAADTHSTGKIATLLTKAYGRSRGYILNDLGFEFLKATRTAVFHNGDHYEMPSDVERYVQLLFLDVVRAKLGLKCREYMAAEVKEGFDVKRLDRVVAQAKVPTIEAP